MTSWDWSPRHGNVCWMWCKNSWITTSACINICTWALYIKSLHCSFQAVARAGKPVLRQHGLCSRSSNQRQWQWAAEHVERRWHTVTDRQQCVSTHRWTQNHCVWLLIQQLDLNVINDNSECFRSVFDGCRSVCAEMVFLHTDIGSSIEKRCMKVPKPMDVCPYLIYLWVMHTQLIWPPISIHSCMWH